MCRTPAAFFPADLPTMRYPCPTALRSRGSGRWRRGPFPGSLSRQALPPSPGLAALCGCGGLLQLRNHSIKGRVQMRFADLAFHITAAREVRFHMVKAAATGHLVIAIPVATTTGTELHGWQGRRGKERAPWWEGHEEVAGQADCHKRRFILPPLPGRQRVRMRPEQACKVVLGQSHTPAQRAYFLPTARDGDAGRHVSYSSMNGAMALGTR